MRANTITSLPYTRTSAKAWAKESLRGFYECPITPMNDDLKLDVEGIRYNVEALIDIGASGLVIGGNMAEGWNMLPSQWNELHEIVADAAQGRIPLWSIILDPSVQVACEKIELVQNLGYVGVEIINPVVQLRSDNEIFEYFEYIAKRTPLAIMLYRTQVSNFLMGPELLKRLVDIDTVVGMKQGSPIKGDTARIRRMLRDDIIVAEPNEDRFLEELFDGNRLMWANFNYTISGKKRHLMKEYYELALAGDYLAARERWKALRPVSNFNDELNAGNRINNASYAASIAWLKAWYELIGLRGGRTLPPLHDISPADRKMLADRLEQLGVI